MNILIPHSWLLEHLETSATPDEIQKYLSLCGPSVERVYDREGESVYDIEVTTNRVDMMSIRGIAREAAVILQQFQLPAVLKPLKLTSVIASEHSNLPIPKISNNPQLCHRILCVILANVQHTATPEWMAKRLRQIDQNVHDSVIDITNYVTHELGHPCHAFDYDKIMHLGGEIRVVEAKAGQPFTTLDGIEYQAKGGEVVFVNQDDVIIDLPAIKGTANTAVDDQTQNILFWMESIDAQKVRFGSMSHAIRTVAAQLNEKNVDPHAADAVMAQAVSWYQELCQATVASPVFDEFPTTTTTPEIVVPASTLSDYLGLHLPSERVTQILTDLGCQVTMVEDTFKVVPPTYRPDLVIPADIVEEIARIYGYHNLPSVVMPTAIPLNKPTDVNFTLEDRLKHFLADLGWFELYTYSMVSAELAPESGYSLDDHLAITNPLTDDRVYLRRSLLPSLVEVVTNSQTKQRLSVFEFANTYQPTADQLPVEALKLSLVTTQSYTHLRGAVEALLAQLHLHQVNVLPHETAQPGWQLSGTVQLEEASEVTELGTVGLLPTGQAAAELDVATLVKVAHSHPTYQPIPKTMPIIEDLTFTLPPQTAVGPVMALIKAVSPLVSRVELGAVYQQNFTFTLYYHHGDQALSDAEVTPVRAAIVERVAREVDGQLVGSIE